MELESFEFVFTESSESYFLCLLPEEKVLILPFWNFYEYMQKSDKNLKEFALKFDEWEKLTNELIDFGYDFKTALNLYVQQFTSEQLEDLCLDLDEY